MSGDAYVETEVEKSVKKQETASTDAVMREVQQEQQFLRLLVQMRKEVGIKDQVHDRVPYFQARCYEAPPASSGGGGCASVVPVLIGSMREQTESNM